MSSQPDRRAVLHYEYVGDIVERRTPFRDRHLALLRERAADGRMLIGGPVGDPPHAALFIFESDAVAREFVARDPYVQEGLVTSWRIEPFAPL